MKISENRLLCEAVLLFKTTEIMPIPEERLHYIVDLMNKGMKCHWHVPSQSIVAYPENIETSLFCEEPDPWQEERSALQNNPEFYMEIRNFSQEELRRLMKRFLVRNPAENFLKNELLSALNRQKSVTSLEVRLRRSFLGKQWDEFKKKALTESVKRQILENGTIRFRIIDTSHPEYKEVLRLRNKLLRQPLGLQLTEEDTIHDERETIIIATFNRKVIGSVQLRPLERKTLKLRQMLVDFPFQRQGIGRKLLAFAEQTAQGQGYTTIVLHARQYARPFYEKSGYRSISGTFNEVGIPHVKMIKKMV